MMPSRRFLRAVIEGLIPEHPSETRAGRARALDSSAAFVHEQLRAMPLVLQALLVCGLFVFRVLTWARWLQGIKSLSADRRRRWMHAWAYGRVTLARRLFRPVRSLAALAYFESPSS